LGAAYLIAVLATPAGISGAVLLLPFQVSVLGTPSPAVTPTNLLYNVVATPGALYRYWRQGQTGGRLALVLIAGTVPGVVAGSVIRVELLPGPRVFDLVVAAVLIPLGCWLAITRPAHADGPARPVRLSVPIVQAFLNGQLAQGKSVRNVHIMREVLSPALARAVREELIGRNVAHLIELPGRNPVTSGRGRPTRLLISSGSPGMTRLSGLRPADPLWDAPGGGAGPALAGRRPGGGYVRHSPAAPARQRQPADRSGQDSGGEPGPADPWAGPGSASHPSAKATR
jgi:hypothetical protein